MSRTLSRKDFNKIIALDKEAAKLSDCLNRLIRKGSDMGFNPDVSISCFWPGQTAPVIKVWFIKDFDSIRDESSNNKCRK